jgi:hypothetical protein
MSAVAHREAHVGDAQLQKPGICVPERLAEHAVPLRGNRREQARLVPEVIRRRGVGDPGPPGDLAQAHRGRAGFRDRLHGRAQQRGPQVAMVILARHRRHPPILV